MSDSLWELGVCDTVLSQRFRALRQGMQLVGRALPVKLHTMVIDSPITPEQNQKLMEQMFQGREYPQKKMMRTVTENQREVYYALTVAETCSRLILEK